jgi:proline iminopeptidase
MKTLYPPIEPYRTGTLKVSALHTLFYEEVGKDGGIPAIFLHGGPGVGILPPYRQFFDPNVYHLVLLDQRGAGRSTPHADLRENTTQHLVDDIEKLRQHLGLGPWIVMGGSWGSMLALCYAIAYPASVKGLIIRGVCLGRRFEDEWLMRHGMNMIYPDEWERFVVPVPLAERGDMVKAYYKLLTEGSAETQLRAARAWSRWEGSTMNVIPDPAAIEEFDQPHTGLSIARIECHYTLHDFFLPSDNYILDNAAKIAHIPLRIVQGRYDVICPLRSAWDLHKALPQSDLRIVQLGAHSPLDEGMADQLVQATDDFRAL